ncbi:MAG: DUF2066 domain-containing protein [Alcanivoracaceae bacterium]|nr:DUF2066 domain-containing protein [Alcanivoracaceae bacterium]
MRPLLTALLIVFCATAGAAELGRVLEPVPDRSAGERETAMVAALEKVLVRLTGNAVPTRFDGVDGILRQPSRWARQYSYLESPVDEADAEAPADSMPEQALTLVVDFDTGALTARLEALGAPVWSTQRPDVLLWAVLQRPAYGELLSARSEDVVARDLLAQADARGLPLVLPQMDSTDLAQVSPADIRGRFDRVISRASTRYEAPIRATAIIYTGEPVQVRWRLLDTDADDEAGEFSASSEQEAVSALVDALTGVMVSRYAVAGGVASARTVRIEGIGTLDAWQGVQRYLAALAGVRDVHMKAVDGKTVFFQMMFSGPAAQLEQLVSLNPRLQRCPDSAAAPEAQPQPAADAPAEAAVTPVLAFCWQGQP